MFFCWLGMPMCHPILILREKGKGNVFLLAGNANVPPNSDFKRERQGQYASLLYWNANVSPNSDSKRAVILWECQCAT
jgi:hypothetical protein